VYGGARTTAAARGQVLAIIAAQISHALMEFNIVTAWAPTYFSEVRGRTRGASSRPCYGHGWTWRAASP
jgi:hypothetical protein